MTIRPITTVTMLWSRRNNRMSRLKQLMIHSVDKEIRIKYTQATSAPFYDMHFTSLKLLPFL